MPAADAQSLRTPKTGAPAMVLNVPSGWTAGYDERGNLQYSSADHALNLQLNMIVDESLRSISLAALAARILKEGNLPPFADTQPGSIAGRTGEAFLSKKTFANGVSVNFMIVLVRLGPSTIASLGRVARDGLTAAQQAPLDEAIRKVRFIGVE
jgi:hypothetical protein